MGQGIVISSYRSSLKEHLGDDSLTTPTLDDYILRSMWALSNNYKWYETEGRVGGISLGAGVETLTYPIPYEAVSGVYYKNPDTNKWDKLDFLDRDKFWPIRQTESDYWGTPRFYTVFGDLSGYTVDPADPITTVITIHFAPIPDRTHEVDIFFHRTLNNLTDQYTTSPLPRAAHELILYGAVYRGFIAKKDYNNAERIRNIEKDLKAEYVPPMAKGDSNNKQSRLVATSLRSYL